MGMLFFQQLHTNVCYPPAPSPLTSVFLLKSQVSSLIVFIGPRQWYISNAVDLPVYKSRRASLYVQGENPTFQANGCNLIVIHLYSNNDALHAPSMLFLCMEII